MNRASFVGLFNLLPPPGIFEPIRHCFRRLIVWGWCQTQQWCRHPPYTVYTHTLNLKGKTIIEINFFNYLVQNKFLQHGHNLAGTSIIKTFSGYTNSEKLEIIDFMNVSEFHKRQILWYNEVIYSVLNVQHKELSWIK